jgi:hypothetical protein
MKSQDVFGKFFLAQEVYERDLPSAQIIKKYPLTILFFLLF